MEVIPEEVGDEPNTLVGYADNYMKIQFAGDETLIGQLVKVKVTKPDYPINTGELLRVVEHATNKSDQTVLV